MLNTVWQRQCEAAAILVFCVWAFIGSGGETWLWGACFFLPDLSVVAYIAGPRWGGRLYNLAHFYAFPLLLLVWGFWSQSMLAQWIGLIWAAHIACDRMLGWGLKHPEGFFYTDMGVKVLPFGLFQGK